MVDHKTAKGRWEQLIEELGQPAFADKPEAIKEGAHTHDDRVEPDLKEGQLGDPNANTPEGVAHPEPDSTREETETNTPAHLEGAGPDALMEEEDNCLLEVEEDGAARKTVSVEGDISPRVELQDPGVSCLTTREDAGSLTLPSPTPPTTLEAASMQRSLAANTGALNEEEEHLQIVTLHGERAVERQNQTLPERLWVLWYIIWAWLLKPLWGAALQILAPLEFGIEATPPLPNEATKPPICQQPEQTQAPTGVGGSLESLPGKAPQRATGQMGLTSARTYEGQMPIREAHGHPPDLPNPQRQSSIDWEPAFVVLKARVRVHKVRRPVPDKGAHTHPDLWPSPGIIIVNPDTCIGSALQLKGEQNIHIPSVGSKLQAAPPTPQHFSLSPSLPVPLPLNTLARKNAPRGEGAATKQRAIEDCPCPEPPKPPDLCIEVLEKAGGVLPVASAAPALAEDTVGVGPADEAETASAAKPEALVSWAQEAGRGHEVDAQPHKVLPQKGKRKAEALPPRHKQRPNEGKREPVRLQGEAPRGDEGTPEVPPQRGRRKSKALPPGGECKCGTTPQGNEGDREPSWLSQEPSHEAIPSTWEGAAPWDPGGRPPRGQTLKPKGPIEAMNIAVGIDTPQRNVAPGIVAHKKMTGCIVVSVCQHHPKERTTHLYPLFHPSSRALIIKKPIWFSLRGPSRGRCIVLEDVEAETQTSHCNAAVWWPSHPRHT